jgi:hypothetical protein
MSNSNSSFLKASFKDQEKREWVIRFDGKSMTRIQEELGVNICDAFADAKAFSDSIKPSQAVAIVWVAIEKEAERKGVDVDQWLESMWGESLLAMNDAFWAALINFSQPEKIRSAAQNLHEKTTRVIDRKIERKVKEIEELTEEQLERLLDGNSIESSSEPPATAVSTRTKGRTAS